jgi:2,4-dienoyl-CoA reductase-like NADH-dependent reductase (Old Yellow Enzyme family)
MKDLLREPIEIGPVRLENRYVSAPIATATATREGFPTADTLDAHGIIAESGVGLSVVEHHAVHKEGRTSLRQLLLDREEVVPYQGKLYEVYSSHACPAFIQINHAGSLVNDEDMLDGNFVPYGPSPIRHPYCNLYVMPRAMAVPEIEAVTRQFAEAAKFAIQAGYPGVEIHACHGFLVGQFLSPLTNHRSDRYGGEIKNRARLLFEIYEAVRDSIPWENPVAVRLGVADTMPGKPSAGLTLDDAKWIARELTEKRVDMLDLSGNLCGFEGTGNAYFAPYAKAVKEVTGSVPVLCTGGIGDPETAERLLREGACDLVGLGRPLRRDPKTVRNWLDGSR